MFIHNLKYTIQTLFKNKILIFWTFAFPIILGIFFNMAFSNIEKDEQLKVFDIAVVNDSQFEKQIIYKETLKELSDKDSKNQLFNIKYVTKKNKKSEGKMIFFFHLAFFSIIKLAVSDFANNLHSFEYSLLIHGNEMMMSFGQRLFQSFQYIFHAYHWF